METRVGEVVESSTASFRAVAIKAFDPPAFGSFLAAGHTYGVVCSVVHQSTDPARRAIPLGRTWEELARDQPQVLDLLESEFEAVCIACASKSGRIDPYLPAVPVRVHEFVRPASPTEVVTLTEDLSFVRTLGLSGPGELVAAAIRQAADVRPHPDRFLLQAGREVADLFRQDYEKACGILRRLGMHVSAAQHPPAEMVAVRRTSAR